MPLSVVKRAAALAARSFASEGVRRAATSLGGAKVFTQCTWLSPSVAKYSFGLLFVCPHECRRSRIQFFSDFNHLMQSRSVGGKFTSRRAGHHMEA